MRFLNAVVEIALAGLYVVVRGVFAVVVGFFKLVFSFIVGQLQYFAGMLILGLVVVAIVAVYQGIAGFWMAGRLLAAIEITAFLLGVLWFVRRMLARSSSPRIWLHVITVPIRPLVIVMASLGVLAIAIRLADESVAIAMVQRAEKLESMLKPMDIAIDVTLLALLAALAFGASPAAKKRSERWSSRAKQSRTWLENAGVAAFTLSMLAVSGASPFAADARRHLDDVVLSRIHHEGEEALQRYVPPVADAPVQRRTRSYHYTALAVEAALANAMLQVTRVPAGSPDGRLDRLPHQPDLPISSALEGRLQHDLAALADADVAHLEATAKAIPHGIIDRANRTFVSELLSVVLVHMLPDADELVGKVQGEVFTDLTREQATQLAEGAYDRALVGVLERWKGAAGRHAGTVAALFSGQQGRRAATAAVAAADAAVAGHPTSAGPLRDVVFAEVPHFGGVSELPHLPRIRPPPIEFHFPIRL